MAINLEAYLVPKAPPSNASNQIATLPRARADKKMLLDHAEFHLVAADVRRLQSFRHAGGKELEPRDLVCYEMGGPPSVPEFIAHSCPLPFWVRQLSKNESKTIFFHIPKPLIISS